MSEPLHSVALLRLLAVMLVVVMHVTQALSIQLSGQGSGHYWTPGAAGVDMFLVLSGLLVGLSDAASAAAAQGGTRLMRCKQAWAFMQRRLIRLVPLYWFYTGLKLTLLLLPGLALEPLPELRQLLASLFFVPMANAQGLTEPFLPVGWPLNLLLLFDLVFALAIALGAARLLFCLVSFSLIRVLATLLPGSDALAFWGQSMVFEFILGLALARLLTRWRQTVPEAGLLMLALGLVLMFNLPDSGWPDKPLDERLMGNGLAAALVVGGTVWLEPWLLRLQPLRVLTLPGQAAYSIYLSHTFVVPVAVQLSQRLGLREGWVILPLVCALALLVGLTSYLALERPMRRGLERLIFKPSPPAPTALPSTTSAPHGSERSHAQ